MQGGGVGANIVPADLVEPNSEYVRRTIFDVSFFAVVNVVLINAVVFGVVLDKFSSLREELKLITENKRNVCFMCDITRQKLERSHTVASGSFDEHREKEHYVRACG